MNQDSKKAAKHLLNETLNDVERRYGPNWKDGPSNPDLECIAVLIGVVTNLLQENKPENYELDCHKCRKPLDKVNWCPFCGLEVHEGCLRLLSDEELQGLVMEVRHRRLQAAR